MLVWLTQLALFASPREIIPADLKHEPEYREVWSSKLEVTPFNCGRTVVLPAFEPECSTSIYSESQIDGRIRYRITYISAERNIWQAGGGFHYPAKAAAVKTSRIDADIPESTAQLLRKLWLEMLKSVSHGKDPEADAEVTPLDVPQFEWSIKQSFARVVRGRLNPYIQVRQRSRAFADLSNVTLPAYCKAAAGKRSSLVVEIEKRASELLIMAKATKSGFTGSPVPQQGRDETADGVHAD